MSARKNEVPDETFVSIDNEVTAKFFWLFVFFHELGGG
jgi:hypothetical protein